MEEKCPMHFLETFTDPDTDFPHGDRLKAATGSGVTDEIRLPLQPLNVT